MAKTSTTTDQTELTISPDALAAMAKAMSEATLTATRRENNPPPVSYAGIPMSEMPSLTYKEVFFCGAPQIREWLLPEEIRLYNQITTPGLYGPDKTWEVRLEKDKSQLHVLIHGVNKRETRLELPRKLTDILRIIVEEQSAVAA